MKKKNYSGEKVTFNANQNKLYMAGKAQGFDQGVGKKKKTTPND